MRTSTRLSVSAQDAQCSVYATTATAFACYTRLSCYCARTQESLKRLSADPTKITAEERRKQEHEIKQKMLADSKKKKKTNDKAPVLDVSDDEDILPQTRDDD